MAGGPAVSSMQAPVSLLERPVYGMAQVDRLLGLHPGTALRWIDGYERGGRWYEPVVRLESTGDTIVTWGEFSEARLLAEFRTAGVPMARMRPVVERLRDELGVSYPLAMARPWLEPLGRELVARMQLEAGLDRRLALVVLRNGQLVLSQGTEAFVDAVTFEDGAARIIRPDRRFDQVVFDPLRHFGEPIVRSVPTAVVAEQYRAGDSIEMIADLNSLTTEQVEQAIRYELGGSTRAA